MTSRQPGEVRDAIIDYLRAVKRAATTAEIHAAVEKRLDGQVARSSVRSYLRLNDGKAFERIERGCYRLKSR